MQASDDVIVKEKMDDQNSTGDVITEQATGSVTPQAEDTAVAQPEQEQTEQQFKERPQINIDAEIERKTSRKLEEIIPKIVEAVKVNNQPQQQEYTFAQLEAFALERPEQRPWVEEQKEVIRQKKLREELSVIRREDEKRFTETQVRQQVENTVLNDPKFSDAFVALPNGQKTWNPNSKLAQLIGQYMQDERIKSQPDGLLVAAKLARADLLDTVVPKSQQTLESLKRQNAQLKNKTMVEGGGVPTQAAPKDPLKEAKDRLARTGSMRDAQAVIAEYLKKNQK